MSNATTCPIGLFRPSWRDTITAMALVLAVTAAGLERAAADDVGRIAIVQDDASLRVGTSTVRLYGIHIPTMGQTCNTRIRPIQCRTRAAAALAFKIQGFVYCRDVGRNADGSRAAFCTVDCKGKAGFCREDLGAWLIGQGWAVAAPGGPIEYEVQEKIARRRGLGVWGFQVDSITRP